MTRPLLLSLTLAYSISPLIAQQTAEPKTTEQRLAELEKRVAELEKKGTEKSDSPTKQPGKKETQQVVFQDGFEKGTALWDISQKSVLAPYLEDAPERNKEYLSRMSKYKTNSNWRATKDITLKGKKLQAAEGKRFLTSVAASEDYSKQESNISATSGIIGDWRSIRYVIQKEAISVGNLNLPIATFKAQWHSPLDRYKRAYKNTSFQAGYILEGETTATFKPLMTVSKNSENVWNEFEIDLSSAPKDKKIKIVFASFMADSRKIKSSGLQLDDVKVFDDAQ